MAAARVFVTEDNAEIYGVMAEYPTPAALYHACETVRDAGYRHWDSYTPFPIHNMEEAMGIKRTILPVIVATMAFTGVSLSYLMQWWMSAVDYPLMKQGKPPGSFGGDGGWQAFVPILFELGVLLAAFASIIGMLALNGLPRWHHPLFAKERFLKVSDDRFVIAVEARDVKFDPERTRDLLRKAGATSVELVEE
jgi:Protein of unknown function (DUF3341)